MPTRIRLGILTAEEDSEIRRVAASGKETVGPVQRARIAAWGLDDPDLPTSPAGWRTGYRSALAEAM